MAFKFNFLAKSDENVLFQDPSAVGSNKPEISELNAESDENRETYAKPVREVPVLEQHSADKDISILSHQIGATVLQYIDPAAVEEKIKSQGDSNSAISRAISDHSDLVPHVYEGGLKVWECSIDLIHYLHEADINFTDHKILELGCGAGLPGTFALKHGAKEVVFQDYNEEVLQEMTIKNVFLNFSDEEAEVGSRCRFVAGDWSQLESFLKDTSLSVKYDTILTSETIYSVESQPILHDLLKALLKPKGTVYVAAKTHYFGVGGGTRMFEDLVKERGDFAISVCKEYKEGVQREILKLKSIQELDER